MCNPFGFLLSVWRNFRMMIFVREETTANVKLKENRSVTDDICMRKNENMRLKLLNFGSIIY